MALRSLFGGNAVYAQSKNVVYSRAFMDKVLAAYKTLPAAALIPTLTVRLLMGNLPALTADTPLATLVGLEANYSGYAAQTPVATVPVTSSTNVEGYIGTALFESATASPFVSATVTGYFVTDGTIVVAMEAFPAGISYGFTAANNFLSLGVILPGNLYQATT